TAVVLRRASAQARRPRTAYFAAGPHSTADSTIRAVPRVLFVNGGILGLVSFHHFVESWLAAEHAVGGETVLLTEGLTFGARVFRRLLCQRLWRDGLFGLNNLDLARFRHELHAGLLARRRIDALGAGRFDVLHFHRQATAFGSLDLMDRVPAIVSVDCTQS